MTMAIVTEKTSPTGIFSRKYHMRAKSYKRDPRLETPTTIQLPDGRTIATADILTRPTNRRSYNLRTNTEYSQKGRRKIAKNLDQPTEE